MGFKVICWGSLGARVKGEVEGVGEFLGGVGLGVGVGVWGKIVISMVFSGELGEWEEVNRAGARVLDLAAGVEFGVSGGGWKIIGFESRDRVEAVVVFTDVRPEYWVLK